MNKSYVIQWKSKVNGRAGRGARQMQREEAERLADELNHEYPDIQHEAVPYTEAAETHGANDEESNEPTPHNSTRPAAHSFSNH